MTQIILNKDKHEYTVDKVVYPSVSQILAELGFINLRAVPTHALEEGRARGTEVHAICESFDRGILAVETIDERLVGYFKSWLLFVKEYKPEFLEIEKMVFSKSWGYCGCIDRVARINGKLYIVDIKTSQYKSPSHEIQTALYKTAYEEFTKNKINGLKTGRWIIVLSPEGKMAKVVEHDKLTDFTTAISAVIVYNWKKRNKITADLDYNAELFSF